MHKLKFFSKNNSGSAIIYALILLTLTAALVVIFMEANIFNIRFVSRELDRRRAHWAAEAGVEHLKSMNISIEERNSVPVDVALDDNLKYSIDVVDNNLDNESENELENHVHFQKNKENNYELFIDIDYVDSGDKLIFRSLGSRNNIDREIQVDLTIPAGLNMEKPWSIKSEDETDDLMDRIGGNPDPDEEFVDEWFGFAGEGFWIEEEDLPPVTLRLDSIGDYEEDSIDDEVIIVENNNDDLNINNIKDSILYFRGNVDVRGFSAFDMERSIIIAEGDMTFRGAPNAVVSGGFFVGGEVDLRGSRDWDGDIEVYNFAEDMYNLMGSYRNWRIR